MPPPRKLLVAAAVFLVAFWAILVGFKALGLIIQAIGPLGTVAFIVAGAIALAVALN